jgi:carboxymethylenebutenolidase
MSSARPRVSRALAALGVVVLAGACVHRNASPAGDEHAGHAMGAMATAAGTGAVAAVGADRSLPADANTAAARIAASPRHGEWAVIPVAGGDSVRAWVVYPERSTKAPVVLVIHEIFGLTTWVRAVADQLAADGFIAIAPDFLTGKINLGPTDTIGMQQGMALVRTLDPAVVQRQIDAAAAYGMALPAAAQRYGVVGFCWGGGVSFAHAVHSPTLGAAVVYYGTSPASADLASVRAPVLGLYGENDARVDATIPPADSAMKALGKSYAYKIFPSAGHGFLRAQDVAANRAAAQTAWPMTVQFFRANLER